MKTLVIAEKPDMGRNIAAVIEPKAVNKRNHLEGERYIITWAIGHLVNLAEPDLYDTRYKKWNLNDLPIIPEQFKLIPNYKTKDQLKVIQDLAHKCDTIVNACDAGREGQYIFSLIQRYLKLKHDVKRLWISDLTPETIQAGFANLRPGAEFHNLTKAARARSEADWLIGMNGSRAFTTKHNLLLSVGRVQTPVLALIYDRQKLIEQFSSLTYYEVVAHFDQNGTTYKGLWQGDQLQDRNQAEAIAAQTAGQPAKVVQYDVKQTKEYPPKLYDLTLLQREANGKYSFSAKKTLDIAQALYEKHKVISYPRTNSNYVTEANIPEMHRVFNSMRGSSYASLVAGADTKYVHVRNSGICNASKVEDHHAILPTYKKPGALSADEQKIYDLIVRRFLAHFYPAAEYKVHTIFTEVVKHNFKTTIKEELSRGWKVVVAESSKSKNNSTEDGESEYEIDKPFTLHSELGVNCIETEVKEKETQPPKPFTEGTLLKAMESSGKQIKDEELREAMKDSGLGTPATRAATIERLKQVEYIETKGKRILITPKGTAAIELIRNAGIELLTSPEMTGQWEKRLNEISKGAASDETFISRVQQFTRWVVDKVKAQQRSDIAALAKDTSTRASSRKSVRPTNTPKSKSTSGSPSPFIADCPRQGCKGQIFMGKKGYGCSHYKLGCKFVIWKTSLGKNLSDSMVKSLLDKGQTNKLKFKHHDGSTYEARIILKDKETGKLEIEPIEA